MYIYIYIYAFLSWPTFSPKPTPFPVSGRHAGDDRCKSIRALRRLETPDGVLGPRINLLSNRSGLGVGADGRTGK